MSQDTDEGGGRGKSGGGSGDGGAHGTETKTRHCQPLRHRNRHPPRETLNHFYCIELSLLPAERTSKRAFSLSLSLSHAHTDTRARPLSLFPAWASSFLLPRLSPGHSQPSSFVLAFLPVTLSFPFCLPVSPSPRLPVSDGRAGR